MFKCPKCDSDIIDNNGFFKCENQKSEKKDNEWVEVGSCDFKVYKNAFSRFNGPEPTLEDIKEIYDNGEKIFTFCSASGIEYKKYVIPDDNFGIKIDFDRNVER